MTLPDIVAILSAEPFNRSIEEIKRLTLFQVREIMFRRRNKYGQVQMTPVPYLDAVKETPAQLFASYCAVHRLPAWWILENKERYAGYPR